MNRIALLMSLLAAAAALGACAHPSTTHPPAPSAASDCGRLSAGIAQTERTRHAIVVEQRDAWKSAVPSLIAARYFGDSSAISDAEARLVELKAEFSRQGCARQVG